MKSGRTNPGILVVDKVRAFQCNNISKDKSIFNYVCNERLTVGVKCRAKAVVMKCEIPDKGIKPILVKVDIEHDCPRNFPKAIADEMKFKMKEIVRKEPQEPVSGAIRTVRKNYAEIYDEDDDIFDHIIAELGPDKPIEKQLLRVREEIIGKSPINRDKFDPDYFLRRVFGKNHGVVTMDSNKLSPGWREKISKPNPETPYRWENLDDNLRAYENNESEQENEVEVTIADIPEEEEAHYDEETDMVDHPVYPDLSGKDLPKRIIAYSSRRLLKLFGRKLKSSVDGTFKSSSYLWGQSFIWMAKFKGHWIPVVHGWLPDKTEESYKVRNVNLYL